MPSSGPSSSGHDRPASERYCVDRAQAPVILILLGRSCLSQQSLRRNGWMMMMISRTMLQTRRGLERGGDGRPRGLCAAIRKGSQGTFASQRARRDDREVGRWLRADDPRAESSTIPIKATVQRAEAACGHLNGNKGGGRDGNDVGSNDPKDNPMDKWRPNLSRESRRECQEVPCGRDGARSSSVN